MGPINDNLYTRYTQSIAKKGQQNIRTFFTVILGIQDYFF